MIKPSRDDIGRSVDYIRRQSTRLNNGDWERTEVKERGIICSYNENFVFVMYGNNTFKQATSREHLEWVD